MIDMHVGQTGKSLPERPTRETLSLSYSSLFYDPQFAADLIALFASFPTKFFSSSS
jgi:hypothetical protein